MTQEFLNQIKEYKNKKRRDFKYCDCVGVFKFGNIKLKITGVIEPNYGRVRLGYELYFKNKKIENTFGFGNAIDFSLVHYLENNFLYFPCENALIIIDTFNQKIKFFSNPNELSNIGKIRFSGRELLFNSPKNYLILNYETNRIKIYDKTNFSPEKSTEFKILDNILIKEYSLNFVQKLIHNIKTFANNS